MAILIASTLLETETEAWYSFYVDTMEDVKGLPTSKSTGSSYKVKKFAKPASQAYCIEMAAQYVLDGADEWRLLYAIRDDVADAILKNVEEIKRLVANTSASEQAAAQSASAANASAIAASKSERISTENASSAAASERASRDSAADARTSEGNALNYMNRTADIANRVAGSAASHMVSPFTLITPVSGRSRKFRQRSRVVLPEPDEPMIASASPCSRSREMSFNTWVSPKFFPIPEASSNAIIYLPP